MQKVNERLNFLMNLTFTPSFINDITSGAEGLNRESRESS
jgi:hypothetical protein